MRHSPVETFSGASSVIPKVKQLSCKLVKNKQTNKGRKQEIMSDLSPQLQYKPHQLVGS